MRRRVYQRLRYSRYGRQVVALLGMRWWAISDDGGGGRCKMGDYLSQSRAEPTAVSRAGGLQVETASPGRYLAQGGFLVFTLGESVLNRASEGQWETCDWRLANGDCRLEALDSGLSTGNWKLWTLDWKHWTVGGKGLMMSKGGRMKGQGSLRGSWVEALRGQGRKAEGDDDDSIDRDDCGSAMRINRPV